MRLHLTGVRHPPSNMKNDYVVSLEQKKISGSNLAQKLSGNIFVITMLTDFRRLQNARLPIDKIENIIPDSVRHVTDG